MTETRYLTTDEVSRRMGVKCDASYLKFLCDQGQIQHSVLPGKIKGDIYAIPETEIEKIDLLLSNSTVNDRRMLTSSEVANLLGVTMQHVQCLARDGVLKTTRVHVTGKGGVYEYRFNESDVLAYMENQESKNKDWFSIRGASKEFDISIYELNKAIDSGELKVEKRLNAKRDTIYIRREDLEEFKRKRENSKAIKEQDTPLNEIEPQAPRKVVVKKTMGIPESAGNSDNERIIKALDSKIKELEGMVEALKNENQGLKMFRESALKSDASDAFKKAYKEGFSDGYAMAKGGE